jgi:hypothetical protein
MTSESVMTDFEIVEKHTLLMTSTKQFELEFEQNKRHTNSMRYYSSSDEMDWL